MCLFFQYLFGVFLTALMNRGNYKRKIKEKGEEDWGITEAKVITIIFCC
jgi:hypothetical protein